MDSPIFFRVSPTTSTNWRGNIHKRSLIFMDHALLTSGHDLSTPIHMIIHINFDFLFCNLLTSYKLTSSFTRMTILPPSSGSTRTAIPFYNIEDWNPTLLHFSSLKHFKTWTFIMWIGVQALWIWQETQICYLIPNIDQWTSTAFGVGSFFTSLCRRRWGKWHPNPWMAFWIHRSDDLQ